MNEYFLAYPRPYVHFPVLKERKGIVGNEFSVENRLDPTEPRGLKMEENSRNRKEEKRS